VHGGINAFGDIYEAAIQNLGIHWETRDYKDISQPARKLVKCLPAILHKKNQEKKKTRGSQHYAFGYHGDLYSVRGLLLLLFRDRRSWQERMRQEEGKEEQ
jgi:hypothetical protein